MTAQISHQLTNHHPVARFDGLFLYGVIIGPVVENHGWGSTTYRFKTPPDNPRSLVTSNWAGYICEFALDQEGTLTLISYHYPHSGRDPTPVNERLEGDFFLVMKPEFFGSRLYVPFHDGRIIAERKHWLEEDKLEIQHFHTAEVQAEIDAQRAEAHKRFAVMVEEELEKATTLAERVIACLRGLKAELAQYREPLLQQIALLTVDYPLSLKDADLMKWQIRDSSVPECDQLCEKIADNLLYQTDILGSRQTRSRHWTESGWFFHRRFTLDPRGPASLWEKRLEILRFLHEYHSTTASGKEAKKILDLDMRSKQLEVEVHIASLQLPTNEQICQKLSSLLNGFAGEIISFPDRTRRRLSGTYDDYPIGVEIYVEPWNDRWPTSRKLRDAVRNGVWGICFRWGVRPVDCRAGLLCAAGFSELTGGCLYDSEEDVCIPPAEAVSWAKTILA